MSNMMMMISHIFLCCHHIFRRSATPVLCAAVTCEVGYTVHVMENAWSSPVRRKFTCSAPSAARAVIACSAESVPERPVASRAATCESGLPGCAGCPSCPPGSRSARLAPAPAQQVASLSGKSLPGHRQTAICTCWMPRLENSVTARRNEWQKPRLTAVRHPNGSTFSACVSQDAMRNTSNAWACCMWLA